MANESQETIYEPSTLIKRLDYASKYFPPFMKQGETGSLTGDLVDLVKKDIGGGRILLVPSVLNLNIESNYYRLMHGSNGKGGKYGFFLCSNYFEATTGVNIRGRVKWALIQPQEINDEELFRIVYGNLAKGVKYAGKNPPKNPTLKQEIQHCKKTCKKLKFSLYE